MNKPLNFILIGRSGSGKGTQAKLLMKHFGNLFYISTGNLFRSLSKSNSDAAKRVKKIVKAGGLPFKNLATALWTYEITHKVKQDQGLILDGAPRRVDEAKDLDKLLEFLERKEITFILLFDISRQEAFNRLSKRRICEKCGRLIPWVGEFKELKVCDKCGGELFTRPDDTPEAIKSRLDFFDKEVTKAVEYYEAQKRLVRVNGEQSIENVFKDVLKSIE